MQKVDNYIEKKNQWTKELSIIRKLLNESELEEDYKWSVPTYTLNDKNVIGLAGWKTYFGLWFFSGVFLKDKSKLLTNAQEGKTKGLRQLRYHSIDEIDLEILKKYIEEAIQNQKDGMEIKVKRIKPNDIIIPTEMITQFKNVGGLEQAFTSLSPGKQKDYAEYITTAKQEKTKLSRLEKITSMILGGVGLHDLYIYIYI